MKYFKFILLNIVAFGSLLFLISLIFPSQLVTSKTISIRSSKEKVKEKILATSEWKNWNDLVKDISENRQNLDLRDTFSFSVENNNHLILNAQFSVYNEQTNSVLLNWSLVEKLPWYKPWKKFSALVINKHLATTMESSLNNFKDQLENVK